MEIYLNIRATIFTCWACYVRAFGLQFIRMVGTVDSAIAY